MLGFHNLGTLEITAGSGSYHVRGPLQTTLLTALLVSEGHPLSARDLVNELWGGDSPAGTRNALHSHISRLRRTLERLEPGWPRPRLVSLPGSYVFTAGLDDQLDTRCFSTTVESLVKAGRNAAPVERAKKLRSVLSLWRGRALGGVTGGPICARAAASLEHARLLAYEMLFDAELERGNHAGIIAELRTLMATSSSFQGRYCEQLLIALYRSGRHADALDVYRMTWDQVANFDGLPSASSLRRYEHAILMHDPVLNARDARKALAADTVR